MNCLRGDEHQNRAHAEKKKKSSESKRTSRLVRSLKLSGEDQEKSETPSRERDAQGEYRNQERFGEVMLHSEKHPREGRLKDKSPRGQVNVEAHHEEVQGRQLRGQGNFEWNTAHIETNKLENYTRQVSQDLYSGEAQHEPRGAREEQRTADLFTKH